MLITILLLPCTRDGLRPPPTVAPDVGPRALTLAGPAPLNMIQLETIGCAAPIGLPFGPDTTDFPPELVETGNSVVVSYDDVREDAPDEIAAFEN